MINFDIDYNVWLVPTNPLPERPKITMTYPKANQFRFRLDDLLDIEVEEYRKSDQDLGLHVWYCAVLLVAEIAASLSNFVSNKTVLELGSGCGLGTISCHKLGAAHVDGIEESAAVIDLGARNVSRNLTEDQRDRTRLLLGTFASPPSTLNATYDFMVGADVVYEVGALSAIQQVVENHLSSTGLAVLCIRRRTFNYAIELQTIMDAFQSKLHACHFSKDLLLLVLSKQPFDVNPIFFTQTSVAEISSSIYV